MLFDQEICITGTRDGSRPIAATCPATIVDDGVPSDAIENHLVAACDRFTFFVRVADWPELLPPQIGDFVAYGPNDSRFVITRVARLGSCYSLNCRGR